MVDNCGLPVSGTNQAYSATGSIGPQDCDITISLKNEVSPVDDYRFALRRHCLGSFRAQRSPFCRAISRRRS